MNSAKENGNNNRSVQLQNTELFAERFEIIEELGHGGMSVVYRAREIMLDRQVAIKVLNSSLAKDPGSLHRFRNEARACSGLQHPNIVQILSFGVTKDEQPFIIMELLEGKTLEQELKEHGTFQVQKFEEVFLPVLDALVCAHTKNIIHRDLNPGNIMILCNESASRQVKVKILDFGIAKIIEPGLEPGDAQNAQNTIGLLGSPLYMSPEQCAGGKIDPRSDVYSLACVMYESIVGKPPFSGDTPLKTMYEHLNKSVPIHVDLNNSLNIPQALFDLTIEGLAKDPEKRLQSMAEFRTKLALALRKTEHMTRRSNSKLSPKWQAAIYVILTFLLAVTAVLFVLQERALQKPVFQPKRNSDEHSHVSDMYNLTQVVILRNKGNYTAALEKGMAVLKIVSPLKQENPSWLCETHIELAKIYSDLKNPTKAKQEYLEAINVFTIPVARARINAVNEYCCWLASQGRAEDGIELFEKELEKCKQYLAGDPDKDVALGCCRLEELLYQCGNYAKSKTYATMALALIDRLSEKRASDIGITAAFDFYKSCKKLGVPEEGLKVLKQTSTELQKSTIADGNLYYRFAENASSEKLADLALPFYKLTINYSDNISPLTTKKILLEAHLAIANADKMKEKRKRKKH